MVQKIEKLRRKERMSKKELCKAGGISTQMYSRYLQGSQISYETVEKMLRYMGYELRIMIP